MTVNSGAHDSNSDSPAPGDSAAEPMDLSSSDMSTLGELAQLSELFSEHRPRLLAMVERRMDASLRQRVDPEDVLSEVYLRAQRKWARTRSNAAATPYGWLYRQSLDVLIELWRRHAGPTRNLGLDVPWPMESSVALGLGLMESGTSPSQALDRAELQTRMRQAMERLREKDRQVLWMRHRDGLTFRELGEVLAITESNASVRYIRALNRLRELWDREDFDSKG